jgi:hypothetical protein
MTNKSSFMVSHGPSVSRLGVELHGEAYIFRNRSGAPYSKDTLGDDFQDGAEGAWFGNYFIRRTPMAVAEWIAKFVTSE